MSNKSDKRKQQLLEEQQRQDRAMFTQAFSQANQPTPLQAAWEKSNLDFLNWENKPGRDIFSAPGMSPYLSLYDNAVRAREDDRMDEGLITLGSMGSSNPGLASLIKQNRADRRQERAAGALENAFKSRHAEATGSVLPLASLTQNRQMGLASLAGNMSGNSTGQWAQFRPRRSFWGDLLLSFASGGGQGAGAMGGGG